MIVKNGSQRFFVENGVLKEIPQSVTDIKFDRDKFLSDLKEIQVTGDFTIQEIATMTHTSVGKTWELLSGKNRTIITPELIWFVTQMMGKELSDYFEHNRDI